MPSFDLQGRRTDRQDQIMSSVIVIEFPWEQDPAKRTVLIQKETLSFSPIDILYELALQNLLSHCYFLIFGKLIQPTAFINTLSRSASFVQITCLLRLNGGKGGYGSLLRAQGNKMSSQRSTNFESCRNLQGQRLRTIHQSEAVAEHLRQRPQIQREKKRRILQKIETIMADCENLSKPSSSNDAASSREFMQTSLSLTKTIQSSIESSNLIHAKTSDKTNNEKSEGTNSFTSWEEEAYL